MRYFGRIRCLRALSGQTYIYEGSIMIDLMIRAIVEDD